MLAASTDAVPIINIAPLVQNTQGQAAVAAQIGQACSGHGFFYISQHGVDQALSDQLAQLSQRFFAQPEAAKLEISMKQGGRAWRGYFPLGDELTSGQPDQKEGLYFGSELGPDDPRVQAQRPLHGPNLFPADMPELRGTVLAYVRALTQLGQTLMRGLSLSLGQEASYLNDQYTADPLTLFRIFHYPPTPPHATQHWGVGEHTDYGLLTILKQDEVGGLQVKSHGQWIDAPPIPDTFVCNIGDMLERLTQGLYRSTPHRVRNMSDQSRYSFPFFFDPGFDVRMVPIDLSQTVVPEGRSSRWDGASVHDFQGTYGDYLLAKIGHVFPELSRDVL